MTDRSRRNRFPVHFLAARNLRRTPIRSGLSVLAILVGVVAVATLGMAGTTLERSAVESLGDVGGDVIVSPAMDGGLDTLTPRDLRTIRRVADDAIMVPIGVDRVVVSRGRTRVTTIRYEIANPEELFDLATGRGAGSGRGGVFVGSTLADDMDVRVGNVVDVDNRTMRVRGIIAREGRMAPVDPNRAVVVPRTPRQDGGTDQVVIRSANGERANATASTIRRQLNGRERRVSVVALVQIREQIGAFFGVIDAILLGLGAISLGVGGIGILNVMLLSVSERRAEIGLLRAIGFRRRDVLAIILWEATLLGVIGVLAGLFVSLGLGLAINTAVFQDPSAVVVGPNLVHLGRAASVGLTVALLSGLYPAWKAGAEQPIEALRG